MTTERAPGQYETTYHYVFAYGQSSMEGWACRKQGCDWEGPYTWQYEYALLNHDEAVRERAVKPVFLPPLIVPPAYPSEAAEDRTGPLRDEVRAWALTHATHAGHAPLSALHEILERYE